MELIKQEELSRLVRASQAGDPQAQERLVRNVQNHIFFYCRVMINNQDEAMDATQDILISMLAGLNSLEEPNAFWAWLRQIIIRTCRRRSRRMRWEWNRQRPLDTLSEAAEDIPSHCPGPEELAEREDIRLAVLKLVDALPPQQRICVLLYYYDDMSIEEIAAALKIPEGTVKSRLHYARESIKRGVEQSARQSFPLYGLSPLALLRYVFFQEASKGLGTAATANITQTVLAAGGTAAGGAAIGTAAKTILGVLAGKKAALAALALAGAIAGGVLLVPERSTVEPSLPAVQPAQPVQTETTNPAPRQPVTPDIPMITEPEIQPVQTAESVAKPKPQSTLLTPPALTPEPEPVLSEEPEPQLPPDPDPIPPSPDPDPEPDLEPEPDVLVVPDPDPEPEIARPSWEPSHRPVMPSKPDLSPAEPDPGITEPDPTPVQPDPGPTEPGPDQPDPPPEGPEPEQEVIVLSREFRDDSFYNGYGGYGFSNTFARAWGEYLPLVELLYSSSDPSVIAINERGEYTTLKPGKAVISALENCDNPYGYLYRYDVEIEVKDQFAWAFTLPDLEIPENGIGYCRIETASFSKLNGYDIELVSADWSSSDSSVAEIVDVENPIACEVRTGSPGTAEITGEVTFLLDTASGEKAEMRDTVACTVTVSEPEVPAESVEPPDSTGEDGGDDKTPQVEPDGHRKELTEFGINSGYGYQSTFANEWGGTLPEGLIYSSSDEAVVKISETTGEFYTVSAGTATLTAADPSALDDPYVLTVQVRDCFEWTYTANDLELNCRETKTYSLTGHTMPKEAWILGTSWSSDMLGLKVSSKPMPNWYMCDISGIFAGTASVTCTVHFDLKTYEGYVRMSASFSFRVTVGEPEAVDSTEAES